MSFLSLIFEKIYKPSKIDFVYIKCIYKKLISVAHGLSAYLFGNPFIIIIATTF